ncbi:class I SAM-dependent methyltransferase [Bacillus sp. B190/17]|uniref:Class I SAM-dependent methyltransferase n=1 Tax=Bacillus lumedeiriae TaxID=3058829 RepID=A0ABW8ICK8_9BACI
MAWDQTWEKIFQSQEWGKYPSEDLIRFIARNFYQELNRKDVKILEVGCGTGANLWYIAREGFSVYGIDGSKTAIDKAIDRLNIEVPSWSGNLKVGDIESLPFENNTFDAVIDVEAIYANNYENSKEIYNEINRVLKIGGKLYSRTFATKCWGDETGLNIGYNTWIPIVGPLNNKGIARFTAREDIDDLLSNFAIIELEKIERTFNRLEEKVIEWIIVGMKK